MLQGDVKKVTDDVAALKPSIFAAVPRVLDRMKSGIEAKIKKQPGWKQGLFRVAYNLKRFARRLGPLDFVSQSLSEKCGRILPEWLGIVHFSRHLFRHGLQT